LEATIVAEAFTLSNAMAVPPADSGTIWELNENSGPPGETMPVRSTVPANSLKLVSVMVDVSDVPGVRDNVIGLVARSKSGPATTVTVVICT